MSDEGNSAREREGRIVVIHQLWHGMRVAMESSLVEAQCKRAKALSGGMCGITAGWWMLVTAKDADKHSVVVGRWGSWVKRWWG